MGLGESEFKVYLANPGPLSKSFSQCIFVGLGAVTYLILTGIWVDMQTKVSPKLSRKKLRRDRNRNQRGKNFDH